MKKTWKEFPRTLFLRNGQDASSCNVERRSDLSPRIQPTEREQFPHQNLKYTTRQNFNRRILGLRTWKEKAHCQRQPHISNTSTGGIS